MTSETKELLTIQLQILKETMKESGVILALAIDKRNINNSEICLIDKELYQKERKTSGICVSLTDFNKDLL